MKYLLLYAGDETATGLDVTGQAAQPDDECGGPWASELLERQVRQLTGGRLQPTSAATTVRTAGHEILVADGPFAETKEQILGFDVIECADLDEAIYAASRHPVAVLGGVVEVRPFLGSA
jgi:hypothetical protein